MELYSISVVLVLVVSVQAITYYNRQRAVFPMFDDADNVPQDTYIDDGTVRASNPDSNDNFDVDGTDIDVSGFSADIFGTTITDLRCFDVGYCQCSDGALATVMPGDLPTETASGLNLDAGKCYIAPFVFPADNAANTYHMSYRILNDTLTRNQHDLWRINAEINNAQDQYNTKFSAKTGLIVSWRINTGDLYEFQAILAVGETDTGAIETYVIFIYGTIPGAGSGLQGFVTGLTGGASAGTRQFARVCSKVGSADVKAAAPPIELVENSNSKCGDAGIYVFGVEAAGKACVDETTACDTEYKLACNQTSVPMKTCTETSYCMRQSGNPDVVTLMLHLKWYKWGRIQALDADVFASTEEQVLVEEVTGGVDLCGKDLLDPDTENAVDFFSIDVPLALPFGVCGLEVDQTAGTIDFAFKIYDGLNKSMMVDKWGDTIFQGKCFYEDLTLNISQTIANNGPSTPTALPPRNRVLTLSVVDRPSGDLAEILTVMPPGRPFFLLVTFDYGLPFNVWADPFGVYVDSCMASNNPGFIHDEATWERSEQFITASCPVDSSTLEAIWTPKSFEADPAHVANPPVAGNIWYQVAGPILAARWNKLNAGVVERKIFFKCTVLFCTVPDEFDNCVDACNSDRRKRRSVDDEEEMEVLYTSMIIEDTATDAEPITGISEATCTSYSLALPTLVVLLGLLLIFATLCILLFVKLTTAKRQLKSVSSMKKSGLKH